MRKKIFTASEAFNIYVSLGENRSFEAVAEATGKSLATIYRYSSLDCWKDRLQKLIDTNSISAEQFLADIQVPLKLKNIETQASVTDRLLALIENSIDNITVTNARDLKALTETYRLLNNEATVITQTQNIESNSLNVDKLTDEELSILANLFIDSAS